MKEHSHKSCANSSLEATVVSSFFSITVCDRQILDSTAWNRVATEKCNKNYCLGNLKPIKQLSKQHHKWKNGKKERKKKHCL